MLGQQAPGTFSAARVARCGARSGTSWGRCSSGVIATGEAFRAADHPFYLIRHGFAEETYFDVSYDPVRDETGRVGGVFCIVSETTGRVLSERRLRTLRDLARAKESRSAAEACRLALPALGRQRAGHSRSPASICSTATATVARGMRRGRRAGAAER